MAREFSNTKNCMVANQAFCQNRTVFEHPLFWSRWSDLYVHDVMTTPMKKWFLLFLLVFISKSSYLQIISQILLPKHNICVESDSLKIVIENGHLFFKTHLLQFFDPPIQVLMGKYVLIAYCLKGKRNIYVCSRLSMLVQL